MLSSISSLGIYFYQIFLFIKDSCPHAEVVFKWEGPLAPPLRIQLLWTACCYCLVSQSCPTLKSQELLHDRLPCPSPSPWACSNSCQLRQWCHPTIHPLLSPSPPAFNLSQHQGLFQWVGSSLQVAKYWSFSFSISPSNEYSWLISFRMDWLDLLAVQVTLKSLLQHHSSKASILWHSAFFMVQISHLYMTTKKTIVLTIWIFVGKVMSAF